jgi:serine protease Do
MLKRRSTLPPPFPSNLMMRRGAAFSGLLLALPLLQGCAPAAAERGQTLLPDFADLAERVLPAVVSIAVTGEQKSADLPPEFRGTPFERYFRDRQRRGRQETMGAGSGFVIDPAGFIVTNTHVIGNANRVVIQLRNGTDYPARVIGQDELTDLALVKIEPSAPLSALSWGKSATARIGSWVIAAGNPFGLGGSITVGIVSARGREIGAGPFDDFIQTDAAINPGNSGGPLFNQLGEVIGINTAIYSPSGANAGVGFATPSDLARPVIERLLRDGRVDRGWLGISVADASTEQARRQGTGVLVAGVEPNSPAARAGLRQGDVVLSVNGEKAESARALVRSIAAVAPGQIVRLQILREGTEREVAVQVGRRPIR